MSILFIRFFISFSMQLFIYFFLPFSEINFVPNSYISANFCQIIQKIVELYTYVYIILYRNLIYCYADEFYMKSDLQFKEDSKLIHKYLNEIRKGLNTHTKATNKYLHGLKNALYDYAESSGDRCITMEEIIEKFGEPRECADQYNTEYGTKHNTNKTKLLTVIIASLVLAIILSITIYFTIFLRSEFEDSRKSNVSKIQSKTIVIQDQTTETFDQDGRKITPASQSTVK